MKEWPEIKPLWAKFLLQFIEYIVINEAASQITLDRRGQVRVSAKSINRQKNVDPGEGDEGTQLIESLHERHDIVFRGPLASELMPRDIDFDRG